MFARLLLIPFVLITLLGLYLKWELEEGWTWMIITGAVCAAAILILTPQINWWYYTRHPQDVDPEVKALLERVDPFYRELSPVQRERLRQRMALFLMGMPFMPQGWERVPDDIQAIVAAAAAKAAFGWQEPLIPSMQQVVVYPSPFPSPAYPTEWHRSEWFAEDGVLLFSARELLESFLRPGSTLDLGLYECVRALRSQVPVLPWPEPAADPWPLVQAVTGWDRQAVSAMVGLQEGDGEAVLAVAWFTHGARLAVADPDRAGAYRKIFGVEDRA